MATSVATSGFGTLLKRGDGGVGAGTQASKTIGTVNQQLKILAKAAGTAGNSKTFGITVSGTASYAQTITANSVAIVSASTSGTATTTVAQAISNLYLDSTFTANFQATVGTGDGSGVLVAGASGVLSGGADGAEAFTTVAEIKNLTGPQRQQSIIEVTHMESPNAYREYIASLLDAGEVTYDMNFTNVTSQQNIIADLENRVTRNFQIVFVTAAGTVTYDFAALVTKFDHSFSMEAAIAAAVTMKVTGAITVS